MRHRSFFPFVASLSIVILSGCDMSEQEVWEPTPEFAQYTNDYPFAEDMSVIRSDCANAARALPDNSDRFVRLAGSEFQNGFRALRSRQTFTAGNLMVRVYKPIGKLAGGEVGHVDYVNDEGALDSKYLVQDNVICQFDVKFHSASALFRSGTQLRIVTSSDDIEGVNWAEFSVMDRTTIEPTS